MSAKKTKKKSVQPPSGAASKTRLPSVSVSPSERDRWVIAGSLAVLAFILYGNTLGHGFVLDDDLVTTLNSYVQNGFSGLGDIFRHSYRAGSSVSTDSEYMYRPLSVASYAIEWAISPNSPGLHHFMNVLWYAFTGGLIFLTLSKIIPDQHPLLTFGAAALFVAHPLHTEVVANIKSRDEILSLFFSLLCIYFYWDYAVQNVAKRLWPALIAFFLALISKEGAVILLVIVPLLLFVFAKNLKPIQVIRQSVWLLIPFFIWLLLRTVIMGDKLTYIPHVNDNQLVAATWSEHWATSFVILGKYLQLLIWPSVLSWDYSYNQIPTVGWADWHVLLSLVIHLGLFGYAILNLKRRSILAFCILTYYISMALYSNTFILIGTMLGERLAYSASLWFCLAISFLFITLLQIKLSPAKNIQASFFQDNKTKMMVGIVSVLILVMGVRTIARNADWKSNLTLFDADRHHAPNSFRTQKAAGERLLIKFHENHNSPDSAALLRDAEQCFEQSLNLRPTENAWTGMGNVFTFRKDFAGAGNYYKKAFELNPGNKTIQDRAISAYHEAARLESQVKFDNIKAVEYLNLALAIDTTNVQTLKLLGTVYGFQNDYRSAIAYFEKALTKSPEDKELMKNLSIAYRLVGDIGKAEDYARRAGM